jgi:hypothetical protein
MTDSQAILGREKAVADREKLVADLTELVPALDRRTPALNTAGETRVSEGAASLKRQAMLRSMELKPEP